MSWGYCGFAPYESVYEKKEKAKKKIAALLKKGKKISPVEIEGRVIANSWWGKSWNKNLEFYADFRNRLSRGRSYVTHGCVIDLQISKGSIHAQVMGSGTSIYTCIINIDPLNPKQWAKIKTMVSGKIGALKDLLAGKFPKELELILTDQKHGLFPMPDEFNPQCNCPDGSYICKHLAAVIYGIGNRLDLVPELLFTLRGIDSHELISKVVTEQKDSLIAKAKKVKSKRIIKLKTSELSDLFDIDFS